VHNQKGTYDASLNILFIGNNKLTFSPYRSGIDTPILGKIMGFKF
jgi:hypothetical protein